MLSLTRDGNQIVNCAEDTPLHGPSPNHSTDTHRPAAQPYPPDPALPSEADIIEQAVLRAFCLDISSLRSLSRGRAEIAFARQVAIYVAHVQLGLTLTDAARMFGRDRTTAAHACRTVEDRRDDRLIDLKLEAIERSLRNWVFPRSFGQQTAQPERLQ